MVRGAGGFQDGGAWGGPHARAVSILQSWAGEGAQPVSEPLKSPTQLNIRNTPTANRIQLGPDLFLAGMGGVLVPAP